MKIAMCVCALAAGAASGGVLFSQPTVTDPANVGFGYFSHDAPRATHSFKHADGFVLGEAADVERVAWWGLSENMDHPGLTNFTSFTVEFYTAGFGASGSGVGRPDTLIAGETFVISDTNTTATGRLSPAGGIEYRHEVALSTPMRFEAGQTYYVAISAGFIDGLSDGWQWQDSDLYDGFSGIYEYARERWTPFEDTDSAFELFGTPVPGPGTAGVVAAVMLGCAGRRRRQ
ncbi:MAG: hypothetical protein DHS20C14_19920 [Phycisphaeraceae bacterium]|nr:MAG: hypothetical protein DHS20C14_19920 [Phycisphaeraceae bacterium]